MRPNTLAEVRDIARSCGMTVLGGGGVVRSLKNWNTLLLPRRVRKHQTYYDRGHYFQMRFDCSPATQRSLRNVLGLDPRMIKFSCVRLGSTLEEIARKEDAEV